MVPEADCGSLLVEWVCFSAICEGRTVLLYGVSGDCDTNWEFVSKMLSLKRGLVVVLFISIAEYFRLYRGGDGTFYRAD